MSAIEELKAFFPEFGKPVDEESYTFRIIIEENVEENIFIINLKIKQKDTKKDHHIKFRVGLGKDRPSESKSHDATKPHFEIGLYQRGNESFSADAYFTFSDEQLLDEYLEGTVVLIGRIIENFIKKHSLRTELINELIYIEPVLKELSDSESVLITALVDCYRTSNLTVKDKSGNVHTINTTHNLSKYLNYPDLEPLYLPLLQKITKVNNYMRGLSPS